MNILGIDLGTANSAAFFSDGKRKPRTISAREGISRYGKAFPSYVEFDQTGELLYVGSRAYDDYCAGIDNTVVWGSKRLIGISFEEAKKELRHIDYDVSENEDGKVIIPVGSRIYTPNDIAAMILGKIRKDALNEGLNPIGKISRVVVSHPAYFESSRREATLQAVREVFKDMLPEDAIERVSEPVAAALGYGVELPPGKPVVVCVIDLGAGTLDIVTAVLSKDEEGKLAIMTDAALGNASFGGIDIDGLLIDWVIREYGFAEFERVRRPGVIIGQDTATRELDRDLRILRSGMEKAKIRLSNPKISRQEVDVTYKGNTEVVALTKEKLDELMDAPLTRELVDEFFGFGLSDEEMSKVQEALKEFHPGEERELPSLLDILRMTITNSLAKGNYKIQDIDHVLLVGGPMHMPYIRKAIGQVFAANEAVSQELERIEQEGFPVNPMECVARGASLYKFEPDESPEDTLNFYYALVTKQEEGIDDKTCVYYDDASWLQRGDNVPKQTVAKRYDIKWTPEIKAIPITLLQGTEDISVPDSTRTLWKKSITYAFTPVYDSERKANYTITLDVDKDQIVNYIVEDKVSKKKYPFAALSRQVGEVLEPKEYEVLPDSQIPDNGVTAERLRGLSGFLDYLSLLATAWLMERHTAEEEQNRAKITGLVALLPLHKSNLEPVIKKYEGFPDDHVITDSTHLSAFSQAVATAQELYPLLLPHVISYEQIEAVRSSAQSLLPYVNQLKDKPGGATTLREKMLNESRELERKLSLLPHLSRGETTSDSDDIANWADVENLTAVLKSTINALRQSLSMPPVSQ